MRLVIDQWSLPLFMLYPGVRPKSEPTSTTSLSATPCFGLLDQEVEPFEDVGEPWNVRGVVVAVGVEAAVREAGARRQSCLVAGDRWACRLSGFPELSKSSGR